MLPEGINKGRHMTMLTNENLSEPSFLQDVATQESWVPKRYFFKYPDCYTGRYGWQNISIHIGKCSGDRDYGEGVVS